MKGFAFASFILIFFIPLSFAQNPAQTAIASAHPLATQAGWKLLSKVAMHLMLRLLLLRY